MPGPYPTVHQADAVREDAKLYGLRPDCYFAAAPEPYADLVATYSISGDRPDRVIIYKPDGQRIETQGYHIKGVLE